MDNPIVVGTIGFIVGLTISSYLSYKYLLPWLDRRDKN